MNGSTWTVDSDRDILIIVVLRLIDVLWGELASARELKYEASTESKNQ